jgi:hypothetical protein
VATGAADAGEAGADVVVLTVVVLTGAAFVFAFLADFAGACLAFFVVFAGACFAFLAGAGWA